MPPVHSGIVPAALPAFSEPIGVRLLPNAAALSAETFAWATPPPSNAAPTSVASAVFFIFIVSLPGFSERILDGERREVAVGDLVEVATAPERVVAQVEYQPVEVVRFQTQGTGHSVFEEVAAGTRGDAVDVMREREARRQRQRRAEGVVVVGARRQAIAPAERAREAAGQAERIAQAARARDVQRVAGHAAGVGAFALVAQRVPLRHVPDLGRADFADQGQLL